jgi:hypothetical protein
MAYTDIDKPSDYFISHIWSGTSSNHTESIGMQPDFVWVKGRSVATDHTLFDVVRGFTVGKSLGSNTSAAEDGSNTTAYGGIGGVTSDGFTVTAGSSNADYVNTSGRTYASWNWKAGTSFTNDASATGIGSIDSAGSVSTTAGFSIISYTGTGANATIAHGLGSVPKMYIARNIDDAEQWTTYHVGIGATHHLRLNTTVAKVDEAEVWNDTEPTSTVFSVGSSGAPNGDGDAHIAYCFSEVKGYSKFSSYIGNGNADGTFVYTGFKPAFVISKKSSGTSNWVMFDNKRDVDNVCHHSLYANLSNAETTSDAKDIDMLSNGFKFRTAESEVNGSGESYIYMAFAENPFVTSTGVPATAR